MIEEERRVYASVNMEAIVFCMEPSCRFSSPASDFDKTQDGTLLVCPECGSYELEIEP